MSGAARKNLWIPKRLATALNMKVARTIHERSKRSKLVAHPGRPSGKLAGVWVASELAERKQAIVLCWACSPKFNHRRAQYEHVTRFPVVQGKCDGCKKYTLQGKLFIHESTVGRRQVGNSDSAAPVWDPSY